MGRLIDADSINTKTFVDFVGNQGYISFGDALWMISELPTAFNVEAVVEELEEMRTATNIPMIHSYCNTTISKAIEIIRKGGVKCSN